MINIETVKIAAGRFTMGSKNRLDYYASPPHTVNIPAFRIGKYPVTHAQYAAVMQVELLKYHSNETPVTSVSYVDAQSFCHKLSEQTGIRYRLPTEAEWEYACRAKTKTPFSCKSYYLRYYAWIRDNSQGLYHSVGKKLPNPWGIYDMHGHVSEWCADHFHESYEGKPEKIKSDGSIPWLSNQWYLADLNPDCPVHVVRGGNHTTPIEFCRSRSRHCASALSCAPWVGFRIAISGH